MNPTAELFNKMYQEEQQRYRNVDSYDNNGETLKCALEDCDKISKMFCSRCKRLPYCSARCMKKDKVHKLFCKKTPREILEKVKQSCDHCTKIFATKLCS